MSTTLRYHTQGGHIPVWDGELWSCPADGCTFEPSPLDAAARLHYFTQCEQPRPFVVMTEEEILDELESARQRFHSDGDT